MRRLSLILACSFLAFGQAAVAQENMDDPEQAAEEERQIPATLDQDGLAIVSGLDAFGVELYRAMADQRGDVVISPASIATAFGLAYAGARGKTAEEIAATLHYPTGLADFHASFGDLLKTMRLEAKGRTLAVNNAIWLQTGLPVRDSYLSTIERHYSAGLQRVDYARDPNAARLRINGWVEDKTHNRIRDLLSSIQVIKATKSVLVNTIYFRADWADPFEKTATKDDDFTKADGQKIELPLMHQKAAFQYSEDKGVKALVLPYRGYETDMVILLPGKPDGLTSLEQSLTAQRLNDWFNRLRTSTAAEVILSLPRFKTEIGYDIAGKLKLLGMLAPFSDQSDFSLMKPVNVQSGDPNDWSLSIGAVIHKVFVEVEEKGTEAAAATAIIEVVVSGSVLRENPPPKTFRADHPFLYLIRDRRTGAILFIGRFTGEGST